jgi:hypothetical protein
MHAPQPLSQPDLQKWIHDVPLAVLDLLPDSPELEVAKSHIRLGYAKALVHLVRGDRPDRP